MVMSERCMQMGRAKRRSLVIFCWVTFFLLAGLAVSNFFNKAVGAVLIFVPMAVGFVLAGRLKCSNCGFRLSRHFLNPGHLIFLWLASDKCPNCGADP
jgi:hypothetical protein